MAFKGICAPAIIYILFSLTQIVLDAYKGLFNTAIIKFFISIMMTILLNFLCLNGMSIISWIIVFIPFILMTVITVILLYGLGLSPYSGKLQVYNPNEQSRADIDPRKI